MNTGSILVYGGNAKNRQNKIKDIVSQLDKKLVKADHPDKKEVTTLKKKSSIGISQIRSLITYMSTRPFSSKYKVVVIDPADKMTSQAQNSLLKILEEPPFYAFIILSAKSEHSLLPTLLSRCRKIKPDTKDDDFLEDAQDLITFDTVLNYGVGKRLKLAEDLSKKDMVFIINLIEYWINEERYEMTKHEKYKKNNNLKVLLNLLEDLENTNVNKRLALENLFMKI